MLSDIKCQSKLTKTSPICKIKLLINRNCSSETWKQETHQSLVLAGLLQLALLLQDKGQVVHREERVGVLGSQLGLAAFQCSALETFCLAARDGVLRW